MPKFTENSKLIVFVEKLIDVLLLNLLWLVFCLPLVTIGASTVAAYYVSLKMVDDEESYITRSFIKAFKKNFLRGTILWLLNAIALYALYIDWQLVTKVEDPSVVLIIVSIVSVVIVFCSFIYSYPLLARYENTLKNTMENSLKISFRYFVKTLVLVLVLLLEIGLFTWNRTMLFFGIILGPMILIYTVSGISKRIFQNIDRDDESKKDSTEGGK
jgi:uncharacterized membrane protein YesL